MDKYLEIKIRFESMEDKENALLMSKYMRNLFSFYGIPTPIRKAIYKDFFKEEKKQKKIDWNLLINVMKMNIENFSILFVTI